jgi:SRSO17 transposase
MKDSSVAICKDPIEGRVDEVAPASVRVVKSDKEGALWDVLVKGYHYLGHRLMGARVKYLVYLGDRPVGALSWSSPALKLRVRDYWIGWSEEQRKQYLDRVANNSRFVIVPWVRVPNLASHTMSLVLGRLNRDWQEKYGKRLWLVETFVDGRKFRGTLYQASNWIYAGKSYGSGKYKKGYVYHGANKEVYLYVLEKRFRDKIGCRAQPYDPLCCLPAWKVKMGELQMIIRDADWNPEVVPFVELQERDVVQMGEELQKFHRLFNDCLGRSNNKRLGLAYLSGLLSNLKAKSVEPIALEFLGEGGVRSSQRFMKSYRWDEQEMLQTYQQLLSEEIAAPEGMLTVDSTEFVKKGKESVGVARQYCGSMGKRDNCQSGVFVGYCSEKGYGLVNTRLYMPESWFSEEQAQRRKDNKVPDDLEFQTKPQIATDLIKDICNTDLFPVRWIGCDATFGSVRTFLDSLPKELYYFAQVRSNTKVFTTRPQVSDGSVSGRKKRKVLPGEPQAVKVAEIAARCQQWTPVILSEGAKGPIVAQITVSRVWESVDGLPRDDAVWLFIRKSEDGQIKYAFSNAPEDMPLSELIHASTMRWSIEQSFKEGKDQLGMDHYEHRSWPAWHRHMIYVFLAMLFLLRLRTLFKKKLLR